jgi:type I restriction enzyme S subunit
MLFNKSKYNQDWNLKTLNQLGEFNRGKSKHRPRDDKRLFENGKYPFVQTGDVKAANLFITKHSELYGEFGLKQSKLWDKNTLCITIAANIAETALLFYPMCFPDSVVGFVAYENESSELFMHYIFTYIKKAIQNSASGSIQDNINIDYLTSLKFRIPKKEYQDKIVKILSSLDSKIELNNKINAELEAMAKTLYDYWFVQFDFPDSDGKPYKTSGGKMVWNDELKREIPDGWEIKKISDLLPVITGKQDANFAKENGIYNFFTCGEEILKCYSYEFEGKAVLVAGNGNFNIKLYEGKFNAYQRTYILIPNDPKHYTLVYMAIKDRIDSFTKGSRGSIVKFITKGDIENVQITLPQDGNMDLFSILNTVTKKLEKNILENQNLSELRDWLLPMLMNGQVGVE